MFFSLFILPLQLKPSVADPHLASSTPLTSQDSSGSEIEEVQQHPSHYTTDVPTLLHHSSADSCSGLTQSTGYLSAAKTSKGGRGKVMGAKRKGVPRGDDDDDGTAHILHQLDKQQRQAARIQGNIESMLSREQVSTTSAWGVWMGSLAAQIDPRLHQQMYRDAIPMMMGLLDASRLLPPRHPPGPANLPLQQPLQQPLHQPLLQPHDQGPTGSLVELIPPLPPHPPQHNRGQQADERQWDNTYMGQHWDTQMPTAGERTASASFNMPPRPNSTPNMSQTTIPNLSGLSDMLNTPTMQEQSPSQQ